MNHAASPRHRSNTHYLKTSHALLYGYHQLSDGAKLTYQVIDSFDWQDTKTGESKGYAFPSLETISKMRGKSVRSIERQIDELEVVGLLSRKRQQHKPSLFVIHNPSENQIPECIKEQTTTTKVKSTPQNNSSATYSPQTSSPKPTYFSNDKNVVSHQPAQTTKMSFVYKEKDKEKKININVKGNRQKNQVNRFDGLAQILNRYQIHQKKLKPQSDKRLQRDYLAQEMAQRLDDEKSLGCYRVIADKLPSSIVYQTLSQVTDTWHMGNIRHNRAALFVSLIKTYASEHDINLGFASAAKPPRFQAAQRKLAQQKSTRFSYTKTSRNGANLAPPFLPPKTPLG